MSIRDYSRALLNTLGFCFSMTLSIFLNFLSLDLCSFRFYESRLLLFVSFWIYLFRDWFYLLSVLIYSSSVFISFKSMLCSYFDGGFFIYYANELYNVLTKLFDSSSSSYKLQIEDITNQSSSSSSYSTN
jgi:hypothetical protein